jgi:hypothetical protein
MYYNFSKLKRGRLNESILNTYFKAISQDIIELYSDLDELTEDSEVMKIVNRSYGSMLTRLTKTINANIEALGSGVQTNTLYTSDDVFIPSNVNETEYADLEFDFGMGTCGVMNSQRIFTSIYDDEVILNSDAQKNITRVISNNTFKEKADSVIENDILYAFDPQEKLPYLVTVKTKNASFTEAELILNVINIDKTINTIKIKPQPILELSIKNMKMVTETGELPFTNAIGSEVSLPIQNSENIFLTFPEKEVSSINMIIGQTNKSSTQPFEFPIGFSDISVEYNEYYNKGYVGFKFKVPKNEDSTNQRLKSIDFNWTYLNKFTRAFVYEVESDANSVNDNYIDLITTDGIIYSQPKKINTSEIYVIAELTKLSTNTSPMIRSCSVQFV